MGTQCYQQVCLNGHQKTFFAKSYNGNSEYCEKCGEKLISTCLECNNPILGYKFEDGVIGFAPNKMDVPYYCRYCGKAYPWTKSIIDNAIEAFELDNLSEKEIELLKNAIPDLLIETPKTPISQVKFKKIYDKASKVAKNTIYNVLIDVLSESVSRVIFN